MEMSSFSAFLPAPDLAGAYLGGVSAAQKAAQIANEHQQAQQAIAMQGAKLQQEQQQSAMEMQVKQQQLQQESLRAQQELQVKSQYDQQMAGLKMQELKTANDTLQLKTQEAMDQHKAEQEYRTRFKAGEDPTKLWQELGPGMGMRGTGMGSTFRPPNTPPGTPISVPGGVPGVADGRGGFIPTMNASMPASMQQGGGTDESDQGTGVPEDQAVPAPSQGAMTPSMFQAETARNRATQAAGESTAKLAERKAAADKAMDLKLMERLEKSQENNPLGPRYIQKRDKGEKLTPAQLKMASSYERNDEILQQLTEKLAGDSTSKNSGVRNSEPGSPPKVYINKKTGERLVYKNGKWQAP